MSIVRIKSKIPLNNIELRRLYEKFRQAVLGLEIGHKFLNADSNNRTVRLQVFKDEHFSKINPLAKKMKIDLIKSQKRRIYAQGRR